MAYYGFGGSDYYGWRPYVSRHERRQQALAKVRQLRKAGHVVSPVEIEGRTIASTFWGKAWCENLERYSDYENRLPRGRTYVRNGSVIDLQIVPGRVTALVSGSEIYDVQIKVGAVPAAKWQGICGRCVGGIASVVELLQGRLSDAVMAHLCAQGRGLFPTPGEIDASCSCPDWALMCKHVAAVLYGIGARLDRQPELLFRLRAVDERDLIARAGDGVSRALRTRKPSAGKVLEGADLSAVFGVEIAASTEEAPAMRRGRKTVAEPAPSKRAKVAAPAPTVATPAPKPRRSSARAHGWTAAKRKAVAERMKRYWQERRRANRKKR